MGQTALIIGATGLVGHQLLIQILDHPEFEKVRIFVRRATGIVHPKLEEQIIDFDQTDNWKPLVKGDVLFSTLGTTIKTAKTKENQYRVDFTYQYEFAKAASENGIQTYLLVSSMGANPKSTVFYSRMKGELEDAVAKLPFKNLFIIRPSILDGDRQEKRAGEKVGLILSRFVTKFILKVYKPTPVDLLATKMISLSLQKVPGIRTIGGFELFQN